MVEGVRSGSKQQLSSNNKSFDSQNQTKIVLRRLPPTLTSEQFLEIVSPLPDHDFYRFCKADTSLGQQYAFSRAYLNIPNEQDLITFTEKFQGYVFLDKNGSEYICSVEYAPNQSRPKSEPHSRKDPKLNSIEQDPEYQAFVTSMNAPLSAGETLPNAEIMLEEIEKKQRDIQESKNKSGITSTPLLEFLKRKREERRQEKIIRIQQPSQRRGNKQQPRNAASNIYDDPRPSSGRNMNEDEYNTSRYGGGDRSNRQQRGYDKSDYRTGNSEQKRSNANEHGGNKSSKSHRENQNSKSKQQQNSKESKHTNNNTKSKTEESAQPENQAKRDATSVDTSKNLDENAHSSQNDEQRPKSSNKQSSASSHKNSSAGTKNRPSIQIYNPAERARLRRPQEPSS